MPTYADIQKINLPALIPGASVHWNGIPIPREWVSEKWIAREDDWRRLRLCYVGGTEFIASREFLFSHSREDAESYLWRLKRAYLRNHFRAIVNLKADAIYQPQVLRNQAKEDKTIDLDDRATIVQRKQTTDTDFDQWLLDVDGKGTNADPFWNEVARWAFVYNRHWVGITMTDAPEAIARAKKEKRGLSEVEAKDAKIRPILYHVDPRSVISWDCDALGKLTHAVILEVRGEHVALPKKNTKQPAKQLVARVLYRDREERYVIGKNGEYTALGEPIPHRFGAVPIIPICGLGQGEDIHRINIEVYNLDSLITEQVYRQTFAQLVGKTDDPDEFMDNVSGTDSLMAIKKDDDLSYLEPSGNTVKTIRDRVQELEDSMWSMSNLRSRPGAKGQPAAELSGVSYAFEHKNAETDLASLAARLEEVEHQILTMYSKAKGADPGAVVVKYPREFDIRALQARINEAREALALKALGPTAEGEMLKALARKILPRTAAGMLEKIDAEIEKRAKFRETLNEVMDIDGRELNRTPDQSLQAGGTGAGEPRAYRIGEEIDLPDEAEAAAAA